jgi:hypothetical protein
VNVFVVSDLDVHLLKLKPFRSLKNLVEKSIKKMCFWAFLNNKRIINFFFKGKNHYLKKNEKIL